MINIPSSYTLVSREKITEIAAEAWVLRHTKSGARLILMETEDENKVFGITFRTPPENDCGIPHILEHSVLCGSDKYPLKDPFVELAKGSLNTFLNAMTFPEKTMYPVASTNEADFRNLMSVYMDAVFRPAIYKNKKIFEQEGWHYELESPEGPLTLNGVVYNEMRGVFSDPDSLLESVTQHELFPDTPYSFESGGDPKHIPELAYEQFLDFHRRYYHPSNSWIYLYGNTDFEDELRWMDTEYLGQADVAAPDSSIPEQKPFEQVKYREVPYGISEGEEESCIFSLARVTGGLTDPVKCLAYEVLSYALLNAPGAPVKRALQEAGIGDDIYGGFDSSVLQPIFTFSVRGAKKERFPEFKEIVRRVLKEQCEKGISRKTLLAGINNIEFSMREADYGRYPKGLVYLMQIADTWIHDESKAFIHLKYNEPFRELKKKTETDYFERLAGELLEITHGADILIYPEKGYVLEQEKMLSDRLAAVKAAMSPEEILAAAEETKALKAYQEEGDSEEALLSIPLLQLNEIRKEAEPLSNEMFYAENIPAVFHDIHTSGILYMDLRFDMRCVPLADYPYAALLKNLYTMMDTAHYSYPELNDEIGLYLGGLSCDITNDYTKELTTRTAFVVRGRAVYENTAELIRITQEVLDTTCFEDTERIREVISEIRSEMQNNLIAAGHSTAVKRVLSYVSENAAADDRLIGLGFYGFLDDLLKHFDERKAALVLKLKELAAVILTKDHMMMSVTADVKGREIFIREIPALIRSLPDETQALPQPQIPETVIRNEGFKTSSQVQYVAMGGNYRRAGYEYSGAMKVLKTLLGYDYLWLNCRVKGGAYGCMSMFSRSGELAFVTYRDPNLKESLEIFRGIPDYLRKMSIDARDMRKYIIGTVGDMDTPMNPYARGRRSMSAYLMGITDEILQQERDEVLNCTEADLKKIADLIEAALEPGAICVIGSESRIDAEKTLFREISELTGVEYE